MNLLPSSVNLTARPLSTNTPVLFMTLGAFLISFLDTIAEISLDVDLRYDPNISLIVFSLDEYNQNSAWETPFIKNVRKEGIPL